MPMLPRRQFHGDALRQAAASCPMLISPRARHAFAAADFPMKMMPRDLAGASDFERCQPIFRRRPPPPSAPRRHFDVISGASKRARFAAFPALAPQRTSAFGDRRLPRDADSRLSHLRRRCCRRLHRRRAGCHDGDVDGLSFRLHFAPQLRCRRAGDFGARAPPTRLRHFSPR